MKKKGKKIMVQEVKFEIPEVGSFKIAVNGWKHTRPFPSYDEKQKKEHKRRQDKMKEYTVWRNGCGIGGVDKIEDGYDIIKNYAEDSLKLKKLELEVNLEKIEKAIEITKEFDWIQLFRKE